MYSKHHILLTNIWLNSICDDEVNINYLGLHILMVVNFFYVPTIINDFMNLFCFVMEVYTQNQY